jgi:hypothetical protein
MIMMPECIILSESKKNTSERVNNKRTSGQMVRGGQKSARFSNSARRPMKPSEIDQSGYATNLLGREGVISRLVTSLAG